MNGPTETPEQAARRLSASAIRDGYKPEALHTYTYPDGGPWYWRIRLKNLQTRDKWIRPVRLNGAGFELGEPDFPDGKPLYRLHDLAARPHDGVIVVEGELCTDRLADRGLLATTSGGADSAATSDWRPMAGRRATIWPDNDEAGRRYAQEVTEKLLSQGCTVRVIDVGKLGLPKEGDAVDWLAANPAATAADIAVLPCVEARRRDDAAADAAILEEATARISETIERAKVGDCGAPFEPDIVEALRAVRHMDQAEFMRLRTAIKKANRDVRITALDAAIRGNGGEADRHTADLLADLARRRCTLFHDPDREPYATFETDGHREIWSIHSRSFTEWLSFQFFTEEGRAPVETAIKSALATLAGQGKFEGEEKTVAVRVARSDGAIWIDLCDDAWRAVEVTAQGWRISNRPPVMFARSSSMRALPMPQAGGDLSALWGVVNIPESERLILLAWMLECLRAETPFAVLELGGEQGSAKTSTQYFLRELIDPNSANNRAAPKNVEDVFVTARNAHLVSFENLSHLQSQYQDALCVLATGGGFAKRTLYTNADETVLKVKKPVVLNGIAVVVTAQDLLDRTVHIDLPTLETRMTAEELQRRFDQEKAGIVGGLLDLLVRVLAILPTVEVEARRLPRMADFSLLGEAVYRAHGKPQGAFLAHYAEKRKDGVHRTLEASPVAGAALTYLDHNPMGFDGTVKGLFEALTPLKPEGEPWAAIREGLCRRPTAHRPGTASDRHQRPDLRQAQSRGLYLHLEAQA